MQQTKQVIFLLGIKTNSTKKAKKKNAEREKKVVLVTLGIAFWHEKLNFLADVLSHWHRFCTGLSTWCLIRIHYAVLVSADLLETNRIWVKMKTTKNWMDLETVQVEEIESRYRSLQSIYSHSYRQPAELNRNNKFIGRTIKYSKTTMKRQHWISSISCLRFHLPPLLLYYQERIHSLMVLYWAYELHTTKIAITIELK